MSDHRDSTAVVERSRLLIAVGAAVLAAARGILEHAAEILPPTDREQVRRMQAREIPFDLATSLRRDVFQAVEFKVEEAITELESALSDTDESLEENWRAG